MYPEMMLIPMREELTRAGLKEARTAADVDAALAESGTTMVVVNSICGCAAGKMRPGVRLAMQHTTKPDHAVTVFAARTARRPRRRAATLAATRRPRRRSQFCATGSWCT
jgi:putative YphP/YqiW family bacilliredoxin